MINGGVKSAINYQKNGYVKSKRSCEIEQITFKSYWSQIIINFEFVVFVQQLLLKTLLPKMIDVSVFSESTLGISGIRINLNDWR